MNGGFGEDTLERIADRLKALADPSRLAIVQCLCGGERNVTSLAEETGMGQAVVSRHLGILRRRDLVTSRREHRNVYYRLTSRMPEKICRLVCESVEEDAERSLAAAREYAAGRADDRRAGR